MFTTSPAADNRPHDILLKALVVIIALTALSVTLLTTFALPAIHTSAHGLPIGVVGSPAQVQQVGQLGEGTDVMTYPDEQAARKAVLARHACGPVVFDTDGSVETVTASAANASAASLIQQIGERAAVVTGTEATTSDVRAFPAGDPHGIGLSAGALPPALGGWIAAMAIMLTVRRPVLRTAGCSRIRPGRRPGHDGDAALHHRDLRRELSADLARRSTGRCCDLYRRPRTPQPVGRHWDRDRRGGVDHARQFAVGAGQRARDAALPLGALRQLLPPGATGSLLRSLAFFDGAGALHPLVVLTCWLLGGAALYMVAGLRPTERPQPRSTDPNDDRVSELPTTQ